MRKEFEILMPRSIPSKALINGWLTAPLVQQCLTAFPKSDSLNNFEAIEKSRYALLHFPTVADNEPVRDFDLDDRAHDAYFHVSRVEQDAPAIFLRMILWARVLLFEDVDEGPVTIDESLLTCIDRTLSVLFDYAVGLDLKDYAGVKVWKSRGQTVSALNRWVRGHQIFATITQGLILAFQSLEHAMRNGEDKEVVNALELAICLFDASSAAFQLTGDYPAREYADTIRPTMMPPFAMEALSGTMSTDHRRLVQVMRDMKPVLNVLRIREPTLHGRLSSALAGVYDCHKFVCSKFVGSKRSLITAESSEKAGVELIEQFKKVRMKVFEPTSAPRRDAVSPDSPIN